MKVVTPKEMASMDQHAIESGISGIELMERAGEACAEQIINELNTDSAIAVICGPGNNGGDGLVISRLLIDLGYSVNVFLTESIKKGTVSQTINSNRLIKKKVTINSLDDHMQRLKFNQVLQTTSHIVDAIFGTGLEDRDISDKYQEIFASINGSQAMKIAVDIPSGLRGDSGLTIGEAIIADKTLVIQNYKTGCLLNDGPDYTGETLLLDIGIDEEAIANQKYYIQEKDLKFPEKRKKNTHKYDYGSVVVIAGSRNMSGAGILAMEGALKSGGGLITGYVPQEIYHSVVSRAPIEALIKTYDCNITEEDIRQDRKKVILIGPGIGRAKNYSFILEHLLEGSLPVVVDADGIHHLALVIEKLKASQTPVVITPHFGEFSKLIDVSREEILKDPIGYGQRFAAEYQVVVVLKGYRTMIFAPNGQIWFNSTGNPGMATGGTGDVLAGMIAGIIGQNTSILDAAIAGVYYHGKAGDYYAKHFGQSTLTATDIIKSLKYVLN